MDLHVKYGIIKLLGKKIENKQCISFILHAVVSSVMKSGAILLHPAQDVSYSVGQLIHTVCATPSC